MKRRTISFATAFFLISTSWAETPVKQGTFRCAVIGDTGTGTPMQFEVGKKLAEFQKKQSFGSVIMLGDNLYGSQKPNDFLKKFELPYAGLLKAGVNFYAVLGNHDEFSQQTYKPFHMDGRRYYSFSPHEGVRFFGLDSTRIDGEQLAWLEKELANSREEWKIVFYHHPIYSSGARHGSNLPLRAVLEPLLVKYGVAAALAGHDHFYERIKPQKTVTHFVVGGSSKLRAGNAKRTEFTAKAYDRDTSFLLLEIDKDELHFQAVSRKGTTIDSGKIKKISLAAFAQSSSAAQ